MLLVLIALITVFSSNSHVEWRRRSVFSIEDIAKSFCTVDSCVRYTVNTKMDMCTVFGIVFDRIYRQLFSFAGAHNTNNLFGTVMLSCDRYE